MEEQKQLLLSAYLEMERARANAETQRQLQEATLIYLQELLTATRTERDEARQQLAQIEAAQYSNIEQHVTSRDRSQRPDSMLAWGDLQVNLSTMHYNSSYQSAHPTSLIDPSPDNNCPPLVDQLRWNSTSYHHFDFPHLNIGADFDIYRPPISSSSIHCSNLIEQQIQQLYDQQEQELSFVKWQEFKQQHEVEPYPSSLVEDKSPDYEFYQQQQKAEAAADLTHSSNTIRGISEASLGRHMTHHQTPKSVSSPPPSVLGCTPEAIADHMPETPVGALPERGKLLQAVMQAGPLLEMLFLTGPLPQWRSPPPALDTVEIPEISMCSSPKFIPIDPIAHPVPKPNGPADLNSAISPSHRSLRPRTRIKKPVTAAVISSRRSNTESASTSSKLSFFPVLNSMASSITANPRLHFSQIQ